MTLWRPECPCGEACLRAPAERAHPIVQLGRWLAAAWVLAGAIVRPRQAAARLLAALGIRWSVVGAPIERGVLLVGNHVSWLDVPLMMALGGQVRMRVRMVAKVEVARWPVIGRLARSCGTIFVDRSRPRSLPDTVAQVSTALRQGYPVQVFPEGTTTCGAHPMPWRPAFLQAAIDAGAPVQRFTLLFSSTAAAFVADESLLTALRRAIATRHLSVTVFVEKPVAPQDDRRRLARRLALHQRVNDRSRA